MKSEQGSINLLSIIFVAIIISTITIAVNISYLLVQKQKLQHLLDQTALLAIQEIDLPSYYELGLSSELKIDRNSAKATGQNFVTANSTFADEISLTIDFDKNEILIMGEVFVGLPLAPELIKVPIRASAGAQMFVGF